MKIVLYAEEGKEGEMNEQWTHSHSQFRLTSFKEIKRER